MRWADNSLAPGTLVEIRNPFQNEKGIRYDTSVIRGVVVEARMMLTQGSSAHEYRVLTEGTVKLYSETLWEITPMPV